MNISSVSEKDVMNNLKSSVSPAKSIAGSSDTRPEMVSTDDATLALRNTTNNAKKAMDAQSSSINDCSSSNQMNKMEKNEFSAIPVVVNFIASFHNICVVSGLLPLVTLFGCFVTAYVFQYDDVHETHCRVYNIVPSISAITGVSPQRYFWRMAIALHIGPRLPIAFVYKNYYCNLLNSLQKRSPHQVPITSLMIHFILILNIIEIISLGGVTYISNRENYPIHEKIFITFMICSLVHMLATIKLHTILHEDLENLTHMQRQSIKWKKIIFVLSILCTVGLLFFFAKHRFYCHDLAFSWFAFFEYCIAIANMIFHFTIIWDFPSQYLILAQGTHESLEKLFKTSIKRD